MTALTYAMNEADKIINRFAKNKERYFRVWKLKNGYIEVGRHIFIEQQTRKIVDNAVDEFGEVMRTADGYVTPYTERIAERIHDALEMGIEHEG